MAVNKYDKKSKSGIDPVKQIGLFLKPYKKGVIAAVVFAIVGVVFSLIAPLILKELSQLILYHEDMIKGSISSMNIKVLFNLIPITLTNDNYGYYIGIFSIVALALYVLGFAFSYANSYIVAGVCSKGGRGLRKDMLTKINKLPLNYFDSRNIGDVLSYLSNDVDLLTTTLNASFASVIGAIFTLLGALIVLYILDWKIGLVATLILPIGVIVLLKVGAVAQKHFITRQQYTGDISAQAEEDYTAYNIIRVFDATEKVRDAFAEKNLVLEKATAKADYYAGLLNPLMAFFGNVMFAVIGCVGGVIAHKAGASAEAVATVVAAVSYSNQLTTPLTQIADTFAQLNQTLAAATRIFTFLAEENEPDESNKTLRLEKVEGNIEFNHVKFGYTKDRVIVHDFCEKAKPGQKVAIVGPTGAGKTTMVNLLMRFYELNSGSIKIEGVETIKMNRSYVRSLFGMVLQDTWLFEGTIMENLKYSRPDATDEEVYAACKATHCDGFIRQQPGGYNHMLGEDCGLSSGQKQLLTIARAMIQNAPMLILDEATSSVDTRTEAMIQEAMDALMKGRTSFVIAHRLSTIKNSNLIIVMKDGDVIETGDHNELMKKDGFYASLYNAQFTGNGPQFS